MTKEILKDEILSDEQLDNVAGGTVEELIKDINFSTQWGLRRKIIQWRS